MSRQGDKGWWALPTLTPVKHCPVPPSPGVSLSGPPCSSGCPGYSGVPAAARAAVRRSDTLVFHESVSAISRSSSGRSTM
jgi:hypothetical protein